MKAADILESESRGFLETIKEVSRGHIVIAASLFRL